MSEDLEDRLFSIGFLGLCRVLR